MSEIFFKASGRKEQPYPLLVGLRRWVRDIDRTQGCACAGMYVLVHPSAMYTYTLPNMKYPNPFMCTPEEFVISMTQGTRFKDVIRKHDSTNKAQEMAFNGTGITDSLCIDGYGELCEYKKDPAEAIEKMTEMLPPNGHIGPHTVVMRLCAAVAALGVSDEENTKCVLMARKCATMVHFGIVLSYGQEEVAVPLCIVGRK